MLLSKALEGYAYDKQARYSPKTLKAYESVFRNLLAFLGDIDLEEVTPQALAAFIVFLQQEYKPSRWGGDDSPLSPAGVDLHWKGVRSFFHWAADALDVPRPDLHMPRPTFQRPRVSAFTEEEIRLLLKHVTVVHYLKKGTPVKQRLPDSVRNRAIVLTLLDTGLRLGELLRVQIRDVDFRSGEITVTPHGSGKKTKPRLVVLGQTARRALWVYVSRREETRPTDRLFPMTQDAVRLMLARAGQRAGIQDVHPHRFRHSFAIWYLRSGGDVFTLQRMLGHSDLAMVNYYLDIAQADIALAHRRASALDRWDSDHPF